MNFLLIINLFQKTGSLIAVSLLWVSYALPAILIGPFAAATTDMINRKKLLVATNLLQAVAILTYAVVSPDNIFLAYFLVFVYSLINQFYVPSESASIPTIVRKDHLASANGLFFITQQSAMIFGFGIAGILNHFIGFDGSLLVCSALLFIAFISVTLLPTLKVNDDIPRSFEKAFSKFFTRIIEGYNYIKEDRFVMVPLALLMIYQTILAIVIINIPLIASDIIRISINYSGLLVIVPSGIGALIGALLIPILLKKNIRKKRVIDTSMLLLLLSITALIATSFVNYELLRIIFSVSLIIVIGMSYVGVIIPSLTFLQEKTEGGLRGRVFGNFWFLSTIVTVLPVVFSGTISDIFGVKVLFIFLFVVFLGTLIFSKKFGATIFKLGGNI